MGTGQPLPIPFPLSTFPGANPQEGSGRLINCYAEPLGEAQKPTGPAPQVWRRSPGLSQQNAVATGQTGYRGGLLVNNLGYEAFSGNVSTVDANGNVASIGNFPGTKKVTIARDQASPTPDIVAVDVDNGAYVLSGVGAPSFYNGAGNLPQPNSVCFQDGYFFFTIAAGQCYASALNALTQNALTFITCQAKSDVVLLRGIPFSGLLFLFTTGSCEVWQDAINPAPAFPYARLVVLEFGLVQSSAIAGWETGFSELMWVAQDFGVYWLTAGSLMPIKVSSPDLERLIEAQVRAGNTLEAGCYAFAGRKFWTISSPSWTWEFNLATKKWNERWSLTTAGIFGRWRATDGHPAFGKWLFGDQNSGNMLWLDSNNYTENGAVQLFRIESGPVKNFPSQMRVARADFDFDMGVGIAVGNFQMTVLGAVAGTGGVVRLTVNSTAQANTNDVVNVSGVTGTTEANGGYPIKVIDASHIELEGTVFKNAYAGGGTAVDVTSPPNAINPQVAISMSKNGGLNFGNPLLRSLGTQGRSLRARASVKNMGLSGTMGDRWRLDVTDPIYTGFLGGTQSSDPRNPGT